MISNKNQLKKQLQENKDKIKIQRIYNYEKDNKIPEGSTATIERVQSNAFTVNYDCLDRECWIYYDNIEVKDNKILYYQYIDDFNKERAEQEKEKLEQQGITVLAVGLDEKINKNRLSNYNYIYKFIYIINEIIEE